MSSYLSGRYQRVRLSNGKLFWETLTKGIPQGAGLEPIIFNIFMNDAFYFIQKCDFFNYADDDTLSKMASTIESLMESWYMIVKLLLIGFTTILWKQIP